MTTFWRIIIAIEKEIFFLTGIKLLALSEYWKSEARYIQRRLDMIHADRPWCNTL